MKSIVYYQPVSRGESAESLAGKIPPLLSRTGLQQIIQKNNFVMIKTHFGERDSAGYVKPVFVKKIADCVRAASADPFLSDTNTLYAGERTDACSHLRQASEHGFSLETMGCPVIIADGLLGQNQVGVDIKGGDHFSRVHIASDAVGAQALVGVGHVTGHMLTGFGGQIKNIAMGLAGRGGKLAMHFNETPLLFSDKCTACGTCESWCPTGAIAVESKAAIDLKKCIGCGECLAVCPEKALGFEWKEGRTLQERVAEYALGALNNKMEKSLFLNFITCVTKNCDCLGTAEPSLFPDIGILASRDIVALDRASIDLIRKKTGRCPFRDEWPEIDPDIQIRHAEKIGLGSSTYELVEVT